MKQSIKKLSTRVIAFAMALSVVGTLGAGTSLAAKKKVSLSTKKTKITVGQKKTIKLKNAKKAKWSVKGKAVKLISAKKTKATVKGKKVGKATLIAKISKKSYKCTITVVSKTTKKNQDSTSKPGTSATAAPNSQPTSTPVATATPKPTATPYPYPTPNNDPLPEAERGELLNPALRMKVGTAIDPAKHITPTEGTFADYNVSLSEQNAAILSRDTIVGLRPGQCDVILTSKTDSSKVEKFRLSVMADCAPADKYYFREKEDIPHGTVSQISYKSDYRPNGEDAPAYIYLPPNYDKNKKYNLIFCLHGGGQEYDYWVSNEGIANILMDNLLNEGLAEESIVVFTDGDIKYDAKRDYPNVVPNPYLTGGGIDWKDYYLLEFEILNNLIPYMKENYSIYGTADHMGICGLSMGCAQTYEIAFKHPDVFHYAGCFSAGPYEAPNDYLVSDQTIPASELNKQMKMILMFQGQNDTLADNSERIFVQSCDKKGLNSFFHEQKATGHDRNCWRLGFWAFCKYAFK